MEHSARLPRQMLNFSSSQQASAKRRTLNDAELDSGDDEGRSDRAEDEYGDQKDVPPEREETVLDISMTRHAIPKPSDGEVRLYHMVCEARL